MQVHLLIGVCEVLANADIRDASFLVVIHVLEMSRGMTTPEDKDLALRALSRDVLRRDEVEHREAAVRRLGQR